ncbi:MAG: hypothetical protein DMF56_10625 [Acidobacteria bacterium]|nr:MAG: hypothetical protein DMF56_10625 [Acidobacteriota bacterium]
MNADRAVAASKDAARAVKLLLSDPVGSIGAAYEALTAGQARDVGIAFCVLFVVSCLIAIRLVARYFGGFFSIGLKQILQMTLAAAVPVICIVAILFGFEMLLLKKNDLLRAIFAGGAALLPVAFFNITAGILGASNGEVIAIVAVFALCYTILLLYAGCRDVLKVSSPLAAVGVPVILLATGWLTKIILASIF